jgi:hypothetical protein
MKQIKSLLLVFFLALCTPFVHAGEGMWLPHLLKLLNEAEMQSMGMKMTAEDIYSINQGSLKDAIVHFGGFCTGEVISGQGLVLTNHHCGYRNIQSHSSIENNILKNGFWASSFEEELPNEGLFVTFIDRIDDITEIALAGVTEEMSTSERQSTIDKNLKAYRDQVELSEFEDLIIRPFFHGNQYFVFKTTTYEDIRLVGTPPESIGKFGADTDNWVWPRHTGDFSLFRIYAGPNNKPAKYAPENKPYTPKHHLPISLDGIEEGDFTLVFGFPGRTNEYLPSDAVVQTIETINPARIEVRDEALKILDKHMRADEAVRLKYASKFASVANYWKKWIGESTGLKKTDAVGKKKKLEAEFITKNGADSDNAQLLHAFNKLYKEKEPLAKVQAYYGEVTGRNIELMALMRIVDRMVSVYENNGSEAFYAFRERVEKYMEGFYKNYDASIDQEVFTRLIDIYKNNVSPEFTPKALTSINANDLAESIYSNSRFIDFRRASFFMADFIDSEDSAGEHVKTIKKDPAYKLYKEWSAFHTENVAQSNSMIQNQLDSLQRLYMKALMETFPDQKFYPDANSTLRVTYGNVMGYTPKDAVNYLPVTYLDGVIEKYVPGDYEFDVSEKLLQLYKDKDYGQYADKNGKVPVCFIGSNHTTGGNSGSPAIDAHGNLIGLNFDRAWEGTMSDINYDASICRNIMVDARYILFIIDKFAGADRLIEEMDLVHPKHN